MARYKLVVQNIAKSDVKEAFHWYENIRKGLGEKWLTDMKKTILKIEDNPHAFAIRRLNLRLANFHVFPYAIHYVIDEVALIVYIIAFLHTSRDSNTSTNR